MWAVGVYYTYVNNVTSLQTLVEHWNGTAWTVVPSPNAVGMGTYANFLSDVTSISANDIWAVGYTYSSPSPGGQTLIEHWDGISWSIVPGPNLGTSPSELFGVAAVSANDVWAAGDYINTVATLPALV